MAAPQNQEKTEKPTPKRLRDARKKGNIPRSKEIVSTILLLSTSGFFYIFSQYGFRRLSNIMTDGLTLYGNQVKDLEFILAKAQYMILRTFMLLSPIFILTVLSAYLGNIALSGHAFNVEKLKPKFSNISPKKGIERLFSMRGWTDLLQALLKCTLIGIITYLLLKNLQPLFLNFALIPLDKAAELFGEKMSLAFIIIAISTILIALIDVPLQLIQYNKNVRMTKQEVKDEMKETDVNPQVKSKLRGLQMKAVRRSRMIRDLPTANIIITNPTQYAVALRYDSDNMVAPAIVAKGVGFVALNIRRISTEYNIPILEIPALARALYNFGEIGQQIPEELFYAVAQVFAYIFQLDDPLQFHLEKAWIDNLPIPDEMRKEQQDANS